MRWPGLLFGLLGYLAGSAAVLGKAIRRVAACAVHFRLPMPLYSRLKRFCYCVHDGGGIVSVPRMYMGVGL